MKSKLFRSVGAIAAMGLFVFAGQLFAATTNKDLTLDDASGDSPQVILQDEGDTTLTLQKMDTGEANIVNNEGVINLKPSNDTDDFSYFSTSSDLSGLFWDGVLTYTNDPGIRVNSSGQLEYRDQDGAGYTTFDSMSGSATNLGDLSDVSFTTSAQGDVAYYNGTNWVNLGPGTSGQFLKTQGASANPLWDDSPGTGTVNSGGQYYLTYYPSADTTVDDIPGIYTDANGYDTLIFEGSTADDNETSLVITNPTADRTITFPDTTGTLMTELVQDTTPQLGGQLDVNGSSIGDGTLELLSFSETASAVNELTIQNAATGGAPELQATGGDTNIDLELIPKGTGVLSVAGTTTYENNVSADDDIPNKRWIDNQGFGTGSGDITAVGSMTTGDAFAGSGADDDWLGLGSGAGRIEFDDQATDEVNILDANVGIGVNDPDTQLEIFNAGDQLKLSFDTDSFATFALDASDDLTIKPAASGGVRFQPTTTDTADFFQVLDQDGGTPVFNVDATSERVGIGTASPENLLEVVGGDAKIYVTGTSGGAIYLKETSGTTTWAEWQKVDASIRLNINNGTSTIADAMTVENGGDVGIGDSSPDVKLEVAGQIRVKGDTPANSGGYAFTSPGDTDGGMFSTADGLIQFYANNAERMRINSSGDVGIGASPSYRLDVQDSNTGTDGFVARIYNTDSGNTSDGLLIRLGPTTPLNTNEFIGFYAGDGTWIAEIEGNGAGGVTYNTGSDRRMKENIRDTKYGLSDLMKIQVRDFNMHKSRMDATGFIAQELYEIYPDAVSAHLDNDEMWGVDYGRITPLLVKAIQDQQEQIDAQQKSIAALQARLAKLER